MKSNNYLLMNSSIIYRAGQKFCAKELGSYDLGATPLLILITIYEKEGIGMQELASYGNFDKGTMSKAVQKLEEQGYVRSEENRDDKRGKMLYATERTKEIIGDVYLKRQQLWEMLMSGLSSREIEEFQRVQDIITENARKYGPEEAPASKLKIFGFQKLTLLDFPGQLGCTIFFGGCNYRCPFCHNSNLVFLDEDIVQIPEEDVLAYLKKRQGILDGVCVSGGEPLLQDDLEGLLRKIKDLGYKIKVDTNGTSPERLKDLVAKGLIDYVAMDLKNSPEHYGMTIGIPEYDLGKVRESVSYLLSGAVDYEFRTTVVKELHQAADFEAIGEWIRGARHYYLQKFVDRDSVIQPGLTPPTDEELKEYQKIMSRYVAEAAVR